MAEKTKPRPFAYDRGETERDDSNTDAQEQSLHHVKTMHRTKAVGEVKGENQPQHVGDKSQRIWKIDAKEVMWKDNERIGQASKRGRLS